MERYVYSGAVMHYEKCIARNWEATTYATSERKARSNFEYKFKKENNLVPNTKIELRGIITRV